MSNLFINPRGKLCRIRYMPTKHLKDDKTRPLITDIGVEPVIRYRTILMLN